MGNEDASQKGSGEILNSRKANKSSGRADRKWKIYGSGGCLKCSRSVLSYSLVKRRGKTKRGLSNGRRLSGKKNRFFIKLGGEAKKDAMEKGWGF